MSLGTISAASLNQVMRCEGASRLIAIAPNYPKKVTDYSLEKEGAKQLFFAMLRGEIRNTEELIDRCLPNGYIVDSDASDYVQTVVDHILNRAPAAITEADINIDWGLISGRADAAGFDPVTGTCYIDAFYYGFTLVEVEKNWELIGQALGFYVSAPVKSLIQRVVITVFQPRQRHEDGPIRSISYTIDELTAFYVQITNRLKIVLNDGPLNVRAGQHCAGCRSGINCPGSRRAAAAALEIVFDSEPENHTAESIAYELDLLDAAASAIKHRRKVIDEEAEQMVLTGKSIPGRGRRNKKGRLTWREGMTADVIKMSIGVDVTKEVMLTPTQSKARGFPANMLDVFAHSPDRGFELIKINADKEGKHLFKT